MKFSVYPTVFIVSGIINFLLSFSLAILLIVKSSHIKANRYFVYACLTVAYWALIYAIQFSTRDPILCMYYLRTDMIGSFFIPVVFLQFVVCFLNRKLPPWVTPFNYLFAVAATTIAYTPLYAQGMDRDLGFWWLKPGPLFHIITLHFAVVVTYALWCLYDSYRKEQKKQFKKQIRIVYIAFLIGYMNGATNYFMWYRIPIWPVTNILVSVFVVMISYAILKYQLLDIQIIIKDSLVYSIMTSMVTLVYFLVIILGEKSLKGVIGYNSTIASMMAAVLIAIFFIPLRNVIQSVVEKYIFKATYTQIALQNERLKRQIMVSERYKTFAEIAKSMAVVIRNPLTVLKTYSDYFPQHYQDREFLQKFNYTLKAQIQKMIDMTNDLAKYSSPDPLQLQRTNIYFLLNETMEGIKTELMEHKISVNKFYNEKDCFWVFVDIKQFHQTLINIVRHAYYTMPSGGQLWIGTEEGDEMFFIYIKDTGLAISKEQLGRIFDPFYRYQEENRGLGLAIAFSIIESHGGKIDVKSEQESGNEFIIQLPTNQR